MARSAGQRPPSRFTPRLGCKIKLVRCPFTLSLLPCPPLPHALCDLRVQSIQVLLYKRATTVAPNYNNIHESAMAHRTARMALQQFSTAKNAEQQLQCNTSERTPVYCPATYCRYFYWGSLQSTVAEFLVLTS